MRAGGLAAKVLVRDNAVAGRGMSTPCRVSKEPRAQHSLLNMGGVPWTP